MTIALGLTALGSVPDALADSATGFTV